MRILLISVALLPFALCGCDNTVQLAPGENYRIPHEHDLQNTFAADFVRLAYETSDSSGEIGIVFTGKEVAAAIPGFKAQVQGYPGSVDSSPSVVIGKLDRSTNINFDAALRRLIEQQVKEAALEPYEGSQFSKPRNQDTMFDLQDLSGGWTRTDMTPPGCHRSPAQNPSIHYDSCLFRVRRAGYDLSFWLKGENVHHADAFADFALRKLANWRVRDRD